MAAYKFVEFIAKATRAVVLSATMLLGLTSCSDDSAANVDPTEARSRLVAAGYNIDQEGFRHAVDLLDATSVELFIAAGFNVNAMSDALSYPVRGQARYHYQKMPRFLEDNIGNESFRKIVRAMLDNGLKPTDALSAYDGSSRGLPFYTTSLWAESLRLGDDDFIKLLRKYDGDWLAMPNCYQKRPDCRHLGSLAGWIFLMPGRRLGNNIWDIDDALAAYNRLEQMQLLNVAETEEADRFLMASIAYQRFLWTENRPEIEAIWKKVGSPRPIMPFGKRSELTQPAVMEKIREYGRYNDYLRDKVFPCLADNTYAVCAETPPK
ncbi:MAG: hypothetical protein KF899_03235 [Parvibaculum sp.]|nr:hypothetical protein [Parvibaculum sp.]